MLWTTSFLRLACLKISFDFMSFFYNWKKIVYCKINNMKFQYGSGPVLIQQIFIGFDAILEDTYKMKPCVILVDEFSGSKP